MVYEKLRAILKQSIEEDGVGTILDTLCIIFDQDYPKRGDMKELSKYLYHANSVYHNTDEQGNRINDAELRAVIVEYHSEEDGE